MGFQYISLDEAIERAGLRMVVVGDIPSPWGEAAKGILHIKRIDWAAVRLSYDDPRIKEWAGQRSGPVAILDREPPRSGWSDILMLAERLAPEPSLLPADPEERALMFGLAHEICGEGGLGWSRRLQLIDAGLRGEGGFPQPAAGYLARKYGYRPETDASADRRVTHLLRLLSGRLQRQLDAGRPYYLGDSVTALDVYSATFMAMFAPLSEDVCRMERWNRRALETLDEATSAAIDPILIAHRDMMYEKHLELPLAL